MIVSDCPSSQVILTVEFLRMSVERGALYLFRERLSVDRERLTVTVTELSWEFK
jgi:hypothetical protein